MLYWDHFYKQRTTNFYKDRHYLREEFPELMPPEVAANPKKWIPKRLVEVEVGGVSSEAGSSESSQQRQVPAPAPYGDTVPVEYLEGRTAMLEVGCAVGNAVFPLLRANPDLFIFACDLSPVAVNFVRQNAEYNPRNCFAFSCEFHVSKRTDEMRLYSFIRLRGHIV